ncbi:hypothetical protein [Spirulina sp. CCNP1310]|uniref:hypothetical protein n=1 Tax=Spirulina sp. CCNP1310 TaxID=3110249 RepID=UPI002B2079E9|nr:hypothetical protein [Spirulina sp. CCNP1310]
MIDEDPLWPGKDGYCVGAIAPMMGPLSLKSQLQQQLAQQLSAVGIATSPMEVNSLPIYRVRQAYPVIYRSPIAQQWAKIRNRNSQTLITQLCQGGGWVAVPEREVVDWCWSDGAIAQGLTAVFQQWLSLEARQFKALEANIAVHYTRTRWQDLLELAQQSQLLTPPIPWGALTVSDYTLVTALIDFGDRLATQPDPPRLPLCQASLDYYAQHRIWGSDRPLAQARAGLIALTHYCLAI